ncbi:unnamed protein product [Lepeophtheirus salmonis]|uniref:(salmon louse) hypothetical protein n=1 Tax=Lepeophtheirus salmonis TaxID=72036 RepID=A0A7R8CI03_LEPSM|nr:unnamed protein product [Lepeophtheirus salmonis]CAF2828033.1 unnamed protein product [Lepeophtheirus salmonis]
MLIIPLLQLYNAESSLVKDESMRDQKSILENSSSNDHDVIRPPSSKKINGTNDIDEEKKNEFPEDEENTQENMNEFPKTDLGEPKGLWIAILILINRRNAFLMKERRGDRPERFRLDNKNTRIVPDLLCLYARPKVLAGRHHLVPRQILEFVLDPKDLK